MGGLTRILGGAVRAMRMGRLRAAGNKLGDQAWVAASAAIHGSELGTYARVAGGASVEASTIGDFSSIGRSTKVTHADIGRFCAISWDCTINATHHPQGRVAVSAFPYVPEMGNFVKERTQVRDRLVIGSDVWIGANSVVMPGVRIGHGAIIGAGAVVTRDVPEYAVVVGVPARVIRHRFDPDIVARLLEARWWDLEPRLIRENIGLFQVELDPETLQRLEAICK